jgi:NHLM bacteriocin system ABC transporter ATP-binding protein
MAETQAPEELFLLKLRYKLGRLIRADRREPILLDDRRTVWVVYAGRVDVFAVPVERGEAAGVRRHLFRVESGQAVFGMDCDDRMACPEQSRRTALMAVGGPETQLVRVDRSRLDREPSGEVAALMDGWILKLSSALAQGLPPKGSEQLEPVEAVVLEAGQAAHARKTVLWVRHLEGSSQWMGLPGLPVTGDGYFPITNRAWLQTVSRSKLGVVDTETFIRQDSAWSGLDRFHQLALDCIALSAAQAEQAEQEHLEAKAQAERRAVESAFSHLAAVLEPESTFPLASVEDGGADPLLAACRLVGQAEGLAIQLPPDAKGDPLKNIARASRIRVRQVALRGEWWRADNGPLLAYREDGQPVALLPTSPAGALALTGLCPHSYELFDPVAQTRTPVIPEVAASLAPLAHVFYRPFPERSLTVPDLIRFGFRGGKSDLRMVALMGVAAGVLGMAIPLATGVLFDSVIPGAERGQLLQVGLALFVSILAASLFQIAQNIAVLRLEGRWDSSILAAVWDRLLRLPASFFRRYSSGDLAERAMGLDVIRRTLSGTAISSILAGVFSIFSFGLLFYYDAGLAWAATGLALISIAATVAAGVLQMRHQRSLADLQGRISGMILQFVSGIAKLRVAGVEDRAFALWAREFSAQKKVAFKARSVANNLSVFNSVYPVLTLMAIFAMIAFASESRAGLSTGDFLAFTAAFSQFLVASLAVSSAFISTLNVVPIYERAQPILQTLPEVDPAKSDPGDLTGEIEIGHVVFRYRENEPLVLKDVSLHIEAGEFAAIVGPSGCGKSTLMRLLLGFETPLAGAIYYDGQDLAGLDVEKLRHQLGVVLQNGQLIAGDIFTNIVGSSSLMIADAWEAARLVGLGEDIEQMPMGMHTVLSEGGGALSGGQRQRLLIARAIVNKPRVLFFDEATSALDNRTQALVGESLEHLQATRVVIAHRLSTIVNADRIFVMDDGQLVQSGTYEELMEQEGLFAELAQRQLA